MTEIISLLIGRCDPYVTVSWANRMLRDDGRGAMISAGCAGSFGARPIDRRLMLDAVRVDKRKWDGRVSAVNDAYVVPCDAHALVWLVPSGTERRVGQRTERVDVDEIWASVPGEWWVLCGRSGPGGAISTYVLHAAAPLEAPEAGLIRWIDLDLDFEVQGEHVSLEDEEQFDEHALTMSYPADVVRGAWAGISRLAPRYTTGEWPFDGWLEGCLRTGLTALAEDPPRRDSLSPG